MANYDSLLRVTNLESVGGKTFLFSFNSQRWILAPGKTNFIPFDAVIRSMGDPRSGPQQIKVTGNGGRATIIPSRSEEIKRLGVLYGTYGESVESKNPEHGESLLDRIPNISVWNMEDDDPITFPHADPNCQNFLPSDDDQSQQALLMVEMQKMRRQMALYEEMMRAAGVNGAADIPQAEANEDVDEDQPGPAPTQQPRVRRPA